MGYSSFKGLIACFPEVHLRFKGLIRPAPEVYSRFEGLMPKYSRSETGGMALAQMGFYMRSSG